MLSFIAFIIVFSILVLIHECGHFFASKKLGVRVEKFSLGFGPKVWSVKAGDTEYLVSGVPLGGYVKLAGDDPEKERKGEAHEFLSRPVGERALIIFAGPLVNYFVAFLLFSFIFMIGSPTRTTEVGSLLPDYPAKAAGLNAGDVIVSADGIAVRYWDDLTEIIHKKVEGSLALTVKRGDATFSAEIRPLVKSRKDMFGNEVKVALIGIVPSDRIEKVRYGFLQSFGMGFKKLAQLTSLTCKALWAILTGRMSVKDSMTGPIGIFIITGKAVGLGFIYILHLMAVLSASLAIFNLLPIPVMDGGYLFFLAVEKLRGKPLRPKTQEVVTNIGITALAFLMVYVFYADIVRFQVADTLIKAIRH